jgi:hypothetical protein
MAPASIVFPDPLFHFQTPNENDESRFHCNIKLNHYTNLPQHAHHEFVGDRGGPLEDVGILSGIVANCGQRVGTVHIAAASPLGQQPE